MPGDFLIVGSGAVGLTSALVLLQSGHRVTLLDRGGAGQEASWAGGGILSPLCPWDYPEPVTRLALRGMALFGEAAAALHDATGIDPEYRKSGMLLLPPYREEIAASWCAQHEFALRRVELDGYLPGQRGAGLLLPEVAQVRNPRLLLALRRRVEMLGGTIIEQCEVQRFELAGDRVGALQTSQGRFAADAYVLAAGAWSKTLLGEHALALDIRPIRGQMLLFRFDAPPFEPVLLRESLYLIPRRDGHVLAGSTLEDVGFDKSTTGEARDELMRQVLAIFPEWRGLEPVQQWSGLRPASPDNIPTIGRHPHLANLYANCGHFRYGVTMSFASAELLLNGIEGGAQAISPGAYRWQ
ncbi:MAG: glycine oxidase ThiO [Gallionellales bacterium GWA2_60_18]|nr:MAG: glycine oxidase ThiO [Gallionellales bacterium GWA2_60_18]